MPSIHEAIKNIVSHGIRLRRSVSFLKLSRRMRLMFSPSLMTMRFRWWNPIHGADINSIFFFCNVYFLRFSLLMIVYYPRDVSCRWKPFSALAGNALSRIFQGEIPRSGRVYSRIRESDSAESWKPDVRGTSGRERIITMYTCIRLGERERKSGHVSRKGVKDFYDRPLETRFIAAFRSVPLRFAKRRVGVPTRSRCLVRRPRFFVTEFLLANENTSFYVRERRKKKEAQTRHLTKSRTPLLYGNFRASSRVEALTIIRGIMNEEQ